MRQYLLDLFGLEPSAPSRPAPSAPSARPVPTPQASTADAAAPDRPSSASLIRARRAWLAESRATLAARLGAMGLRDTDEIRTHANARIMVSWSARTLRLHGGYAVAPDQVLLAIVRFLDRRTPGALRSAARRVLLEYPAHEKVPQELRAPRTAGRRRGPVEAPRPGDERLLRLLRERHALLNRQHFDGALTDLPLHLSGRMKRKLGHVSLESGRVTEIVMSRRHMQRDGEAAWMETLLHEMVHQWQAETGRPVDHGAEFRRKAREVGITPRAVRPR